MNKQAIIGFFRPSLVVLIIMAIFIPVMLIGLADRYAFDCGGDGHKCEGMDVRKPDWYGIDCSCWLIWVMSSAPILILEYNLFTNPAGAPVDSIMWETSAVGSISVIAFAGNIAYYYVGACFMAYLIRKVARQPSAQGIERVKS